MIRLTWTDADGVQHFGVFYGFGVREEPAAKGKRPTLVTCAMVLDDVAPDVWTMVPWFETRPIGGMAQMVIA